MNSVRCIIPTLSPDDFPGVSLDEMRELHVNDLDPLLSEEKIDRSCMLFERIWNRLVAKQLLVDYDNGYFGVKVPSKQNSLTRLD